MAKFVLQADFNFQWKNLMTNPGENLAKRIEDCYFYNVDHCGMKVDAILWETHCFLPQEQALNNRDVYKFFVSRGLDMMAHLIDACHRRGIQAILHHRASEVELYDETGRKRPLSPLKQARPDWVIKTWYDQGLWNFDNPELREFKLDYLESMMKTWDFDGICVDFARHTPLLPVGRQWDCRESLTAFMTGLRQRMEVIRPGLLVGAKVPESPRCCREDGFDISAWIQRGAVDFLELGSRTMAVDVPWYRSLTAGTGVEIYPCWDCFHSSDAMHLLGKAQYRGILGNWLAQGADGVVGFNFAPADYARMSTLGIDNLWGCNEAINPDFGEYYEAFLDCTDPETNRICAAERRGGYPYTTGTAGTNCYAPLPKELPNDGTPAKIILKTAFAGKTGTVRLVLSGAKVGDCFQVFVNGRELEYLNLDFHHIDRQIFWPQPQRPSGRSYCFTEHPSELLEITAPVSGLRWENEITCAVTARQAFMCDNIHLERVEIHGDNQ